MPGRDETRHRLTQFARAHVCLPDVRPTLREQPTSHELDGQHPEQRDLRVRREDLVRPQVEPLSNQEPAVDP